MPRYIDADEIIKKMVTHGEAIGDYIIGLHEGFNICRKLVDNAPTAFPKKDGLIVELPCKVGDKVYVIAKCGEIMMYQDNDYLTGTGEITCPFENACNFEECDDENIQIIETECGGFTLDAGKWFVWLANISRDILVSDFGKTVFLTREAAEKRLEESK